MAVSANIRLDIWGKSHVDSHSPIPGSTLLWTLRLTHPDEMKHFCTFL